MMSRQLQALSSVLLGPSDSSKAPRADWHRRGEPRRHAPLGMALQHEQCDTARQHRGGTSCCVDATCYDALPLSVVVVRLRAQSRRDCAATLLNVPPAPFTLPSLARGLRQPYEYSSAPRYRQVALHTPCPRTGVGTPALLTTRTLSTIHLRSSRGLSPHRISPSSPCTLVHHAVPPSLQGGRVAHPSSGRAHAALSTCAFTTGEALHPPLVRCVALMPHIHSEAQHRRPQAQALSARPRNRLHFVLHGPAALLEGRVVYRRLAAEEFCLPFLVTGECPPPDTVLISFRGSLTLRLHQL